TGSWALLAHRRAMLAGPVNQAVDHPCINHADIATTTIYTQVAIGALKAIHDATHPGATNTRRSRVDPPHTAGPDTVQPDTAMPHMDEPHTATPPLQASAAALLAAIDAEADDDEDLDDPG
ncbi:MAG: hypothetical protein ACRD0F_06985, partial [Acidimicrobiales bacterium]